MVWGPKELEDTFSAHVLPYLVCSRCPVGNSFWHRKPLFVVVTEVVRCKTERFLPEQTQGMMKDWAEVLHFKPPAVRHRAGSHRHAWAVNVFPGSQEGDCVNNAMHSSQMKSGCQEPDSRVDLYLPSVFICTSLKPRAHFAHDPSERRKKVEHSSFFTLDHG